MSKVMYSLTMYRFGERDKHSYLYGIYSKKHAALKECEEEEAHTGQKYMGEVIEHTVDSSHQKIIKELKKPPYISEEEISQKEQEKARTEKIMRQFQ